MTEAIKIIDNDYAPTASLSATSEASGYDIENSVVMRKSSTWRSTNLATQTITLIWGTGVPVSAIALAFNNLIAGSTYQFKLYTNSGDGSPVFSITATAVQFAYDIPANETSINSTSFQRGGGNYISEFFDEETVEKVEIVLTSASNPDGFIEIGNVMAGSSVEIEGGADFGSAVSMVSTGETERHESTQLSFRKGAQYKALQINRELLGAAARQTLDTALKSFGHGFPFFISVMDEDGTNEERISYQIYGLVSNDNSFNMVLYNQVSTTIEISEI